LNWRKQKFRCTGEEKIELEKAERLVDAVFLSCDFSPSVISGRWESSEMLVGACLVYSGELGH
jgi:hypothetical protein